MARRGQGPTGQFSLRTNGEGIARAEGLPGREVEVRARPGRRYIAPERVSILPDGREVRIVLRKALWIRGVVLSPEGEPLPRILVRANYRREGMGQSSAYTDEEGRFAIPCVGGEVVDLVVDGQIKLPGGPNVRRWGESPYRGEVAGVAAPASGIEVRTSEDSMNRSLTVIVLDPDEKPVPSTGVRIYGTGKEGRRAQTDESGRAVFSGLPAQTMRIVADRPHREPYRETVVASEGVDVLPEGQEVTLRLREAFVIAGKVVDAEGKPTAGAQVTLDVQQKYGESRITNAEGRFRLTAPRGYTCELSVLYKPAPRVFLRTSLDGVTESDGEIILRLPER